MQILSLDSVDSTQNYLKELVKQNKVTPPLAVVAKTQTNGIGSRENTWSGMDGNLFLSFAIPLSNLPKDLKLESASIYFAYLLKDSLSESNSKVWLKWPNDFYIGNKKIGGMITHVVEKTLVCGVGLNIENSPENFAKLDIKISIDELLNKYFESVEKNVLWKQVFSKYELEFHKNKNFFTHKNNLKISLKDVVLQSDGSIISDGERIYSLR
ncbi:biotin--[acetyl-CoA-carboxylase] ligase [Candidatus Sulfurimonas baltica]|uniref:Biotin--[acetyl-CoA-carboxylase] ligase n=1 Tax=Candidatus Sulfurimonas baltica TaxID=2740404 RepID=A0A7S7LY80_9BACT|nr:biotin--[acetyl-CoA-carboxylase] ligase [Candidatus Sulfurimonas baltica]QOY52789.1 biotin--[acetyl-CoA-carboxylase] ligase [Candidatus Sulfurimonas baltica]